VALRYFNTYGPRQTYTPYVGVITIFIRQLLQGEPPMIFGDGTQCRDFVHVDDVVDCTYRAMIRHVPGEVLNVGSGIGTSVNEVAALLTARLRPGLRPVYCEEHPGELRNSIADIHKARALLEYQPRFKLEDKVDDIIAWNRGVV
jgi:nucleoside-diphosphate-sugar epimerase